MTITHALPSPFHALLLVVLAACSGGSSGGGGGAPPPPPSPGVFARTVFPGPSALSDADTLAVRGVAGSSDGSAVGDVQVNGAPVVTTDGFASWSVDAALQPGDNRLELEATDGSGRPGTVPAPHAIQHGGSIWTNITDLAVDGSRDRWFVVDNSSTVVSAFDGDSGVRSVVSSASRGSGPLPDRISSVAYDPAGDQLVVLGTGGLDAFRLLIVDPVTGNRRVLRQVTDEAGRRVVVDSARNRALVVGRVFRNPTGSDVSLLAFDLVSGRPSVVSRNSTHGGPAMGFDNALVVDTAHDRALVFADNNFSAIVAVDLANGERSPITSDARGSGPALIRGRDIAVEPGGATALVTCQNPDGARQILQVDLATGDRVLVVDERSPGGPPLVLPDQIEIDPARSRALVGDGDAVVALDLTSQAFGSRQAVSEISIGRGEAIGNVFSHAHSPERNEIYVPNAGRDGIIAIDLATGDRRVLSSSDPLRTVGQGIALQFVSHLACDDRGDRVIVIDTVRKALAGIDLDTGDRTLLTGEGDVDLPVIQFAIDATNERAVIQAFGALAVVPLAPGGPAVVVSDGQRGSGPQILPGPLAFDERSGAWLTRGPDSSVIAVDLASGDRTELVRTGLTSSESIEALALDGDDVLVLFQGEGVARWQLDAFDRSTGLRRKVSGDLGGGPAPILARGQLHVDQEQRLAWFIDSTRRAIGAVDLVRGDRVLVSKAGLQPPQR